MRFSFVRVSLFVPALVAAYVLACGGDSTSAEPAPLEDGGVAASLDGGGNTPPSPIDGGQHAPPIPENEFLAAMLAAQCDPMPACCELEGLPFVPGACGARFMDAGLGSLNLEALLLDAGIRTYDPQAAGDCVAATRAVGTLCSAPKADKVAAGIFLYDVTDGLLACGRVVAGSVPEGQPCGPTILCAPPTRSKAISGCKVSAGSDAGNCHTTSFDQQLGEPCRANSDADAGESDDFCGVPPGSDFDASSYEGLLGCRESTATCALTHEVPPGQPCDGTQLLVCGHGFGCTAGICVARQPLGATCGGGLRCLEEARCDATGHCVALKPLGETCSANDECISEHCNAKKVCVGAVGGSVTPAQCSGT